VEEKFMEEEIVLSCTKCGKLFHLSHGEDKALRESISGIIWEVDDFARHFKCWHCLQVKRD
jgi:hypothetical protein